MTDLRLGINLWSQAATWQELLAAARRVDALAGHVAVVAMLISFERGVRLRERPWREELAVSDARFAAEVGWQFDASSRAKAMSLTHPPSRACSAADIFGKRAASCSHFCLRVESMPAQSRSSGFSEVC